MTKPTGRPRGRPHKNPLPETETTPDSTTTTVDVGENEEAVIEERIAQLERERASLEGPPAPLTLTDIAQGAVALVDKHEQRRSTIERLLAAYRIKRLEIQRKKYERKLEPHLATREKAGERLQELEAQRIALQEEIDKARIEWSDANTRVVSGESHVRRINREIRELEGGAGAR